MDRPLTRDCFVLRRLLLVLISCLPLFVAACGPRFDGEASASLEDAFNVLQDHYAQHGDLPDRATFEAKLRKADTIARIDPRWRYEWSFKQEPAGPYHRALRIRLQTPEGRPYIQVFPLDVRRK